MADLALDGTETDIVVVVNTVVDVVDVAAVDVVGLDESEDPNETVIFASATASEVGAGSRVPEEDVDHQQKNMKVSRIDPTQKIPVIR